MPQLAELADVAAPQVQLGPDVGLEAITGLISAIATPVVGGLLNAGAKALGVGDRGPQAIDPRSRDLFSRRQPLWGVPLEVPGDFGGLGLHRCSASLTVRAEDQLPILLGAMRDRVEAHGTRDPVFQDVDTRDWPTWSAARWAERNVLAWFANGPTARDRRYIWADGWRGSGVELLPAGVDYQCPNTLQQRHGLDDPEWSALFAAGALFMDELPRDPLRPARADPTFISGAALSVGASFFTPVTPQAAAARRSFDDFRAERSDAGRAARDEYEARRADQLVRYAVQRHEWLAWRQALANELLRREAEAAQLAAFNAAWQQGVSTGQIVGVWDGPAEPVAPIVVENPITSPDAPQLILPQDVEPVPDDVERETALLPTATQALEQLHDALGSTFVAADRERPGGRAFGAVALLVLLGGALWALR